MSNSPERYSSNSESFIQKRRKQLLALAAVVIIAAGGVSYKIAVSNNGGIKNEPVQVNKFLNQIGQSLIDHHENSQDGWRFKSAIQAPHYQTDRDVGAASVGMGFLALAEAEPHDSRWVDSAKNTAAWLVAVSSQDGKGGRYWRDYVDDNETSSDVYTSFDDGTIGIGDYFWQLYEKTGDPKYKQIYIETLNWTLSQAEAYKKDGLSGYRWKWDVKDPNSPYYMGMGEGAAGITYSLAAAYQRLQHSDPAMAGRCKTYMEGSLNYIDIVRREQAKIIGAGRTIPETGVVGQDGDTELDAGYLSGAAGDAYMYLSLYNIFGNKEYLNKTTELLGWLSDSNHGPMVKTDDNSVTWKLALDPQSGDNSRYATGMEEGNAGIGWTFLQAYKLTGNESYLHTAEASANWLYKVAIKESDGSLSWHEDEHPVNPLVHSNLNNGGGGIGMNFEDLASITHNHKFHRYALGTLKGLLDNAKFKGKDIYWSDNGGGSVYSSDPSWHWGLAGIAEFAQRMEGGRQDIPTEQPGIMQNRKD